MEPQFKTSFIPKSPVVASQESKVNVVHTTNIFSVTATVLFLVAFFASGSLFIYKNILEDQIQKADDNITSARSAFEPEKIKELLDSDSRISSSKRLLEKHVAVSKLLTLLQALTVKRMRFSDLNYSNRNGSQNLQMKGEVQTYNALAEQRDIFSKDEFIINPKFTDFLPGENGTVGFSFSAVLDSNLVSYKRAIESLSINQ